MLDDVEKLIETGLDLCAKYKAARKQRPCLQSDLEKLRRDIWKLRQQGIVYSQQLVDVLAADDFARQHALPLFPEL